MPGYKPKKDRITLLFCANASGDPKIKPLLVYHSETPRIFKKENVIYTVELVIAKQLHVSALYVGHHQV